MKGIVTLCGSVRFKDLFYAINAKLTDAGFVVLAPGIFEHEWLHRPENNAELRKNALDKLHCEKIDMSQAIFIVNPKGYVGKSTGNEISYANSKGKLIYYLEGLENLDLLLKTDLTDIDEYGRPKIFA